MIDFCQWLREGDRPPKSRQSQSYESTCTLRICHLEDYHSVAWPVVFTASVAMVIKAESVPFEIGHGTLVVCFLAIIYSASNFNEMKYSYSPEN